MTTFKASQFEIVAREDFSEVTYLLEILHPLMARAARPGQFVIVMAHEHGERIPLTIADFDGERGTITLVIQAVGKTTREMQQTCVVGSKFYGLAGPMGIPSPLRDHKKVICVGGGLGVAPVFPQARGFKESGAYVVGVLGFRNKDLVFWKDKFESVCDELILCTDDGSAGIKGFVTDGLRQALEKHPDADEVVAIGPPVMMKACAETTRPYGVKTIVSLNPIMVDGTGMCGGCRVKVGEQVRFACVDGPDFDGHLVDFDDLTMRLRRYKEEEKAALERWSAECRMMDPADAVSTLPEEKVEGRRSRAEETGIPSETIVNRQSSIQSPSHSKIQNPKSKISRWAMAKKRTVRTIPQLRTPVKELDPRVRASNFAEVNCGYCESEAILESERCLFCPDPACIEGCPVGINIPDFIRLIGEKDYRKAYETITQTNLLPAVCGRVCPQENQCEKVCVVGETLEPVAIGRLERFVGDMSISEGWTSIPHIEPNAFRVGIVGSGPAGMACAADMAKAGCMVTVFEAFHQPGGVLRYGIPDFRLPNRVIDAEIANLRKLGVEFQCNTLVGRLFTIEQMIEELGFHAVFIGTGAGYPALLGIPGDSLNGVLSANELLTRCNLMRAKEFPAFDTPMPLGRKVAVVGAGNTAMDALRVSLRLGAEEVHCIYRRSKAEAPARAEEIHHAEEEGIVFHWLTNPVEVLDDGEGNVRGMRCIQMELGEPDDSGRRRPVPVEGSEFEFEADQVVFAIGTNANPIIGQTSNLKLNKWGYIQADGSLATSMAGVFAGGDIVTGAATVIEAMGAGRKAAAAMKEYLGIRDVSLPYDEGPSAFGISDRSFARVRLAGVAT